MISKLEIPASKTITEVRKLELPPVSNLVVKVGGMTDKSQCYTFIQSMAILLNQFFGVHWTDEQVSTVAVDLYSEHYYWSIGDWKLFSAKCKRCEFDPDRKVYSWTPDKLISWAASYDLQWMQCSDQISQHNHGISKRTEERSSDSDRQKKTNEEHAFKNYELKYNISNGAG